MIIREHETFFILVQQHHHGQLAGALMSHWNPGMFRDDRWRSSVLTAIENHDIGWVPFDEQPFWNDAKSAPFRFTDFPLLPKLVLYRRGIDRVEEMDAYAAMLCSLHYEQFIQNSAVKEAEEFMREERKRRERLSAGIEGFDKELFKDHFALLQLGDNFSLYCCVNDPGARKTDEHVFFRNGIPSPVNFPALPKGRIGIHFSGQSTIRVEDFPFTHPFDIGVKQKKVLKKDIAASGWQAAYDSAEYESVTLHIAPPE